MSLIVYNGIPLAILQTRSYAQQNDFDESDTDLLRVRHRGSWVCTVAANVWPAAGGETLVQAWNRIKHALSMPRRTFQWWHNGQIMLACPAVDAGAGVAIWPAGPAIDANNGPKPRLISITKLTEGSFMVEWAIEICEASCYGNPASSLYTSFRWSQTQTYDRRWFGTLRTAGELTVQSDLRSNADGLDLRGIVAPQIVNGYRREKAQYTLSKDGLKLSFEFEDRQYHRLPPAGCGEADGRFTVMTSDAAGSMLMAQCDITLSGVPGQGTKALVEMASGIAMQKLIGSNLFNVGQPGGAASYQVQGHITEHLWDNRIELSFRGILNSQVQGKTGPSVLAGIAEGAVAGALPGLKVPLRGSFAAGAAAQAGKRFNSVAITPDLFGQPLGLYQPNAAPAPVSPDCDEQNTDVPGVAPFVGGYGAVFGLIALALNDPCLAAASQSSANMKAQAGGGTSQISGGGTSQMSAVGDAPPPTGSFIGGALSVLQAAQQEDDWDAVGADFDTDSIVQDPFTGVWESWLVKCTYEDDQNTTVLESTAPAAPAIAVNFANPTLYLKCAWTGSRTGAPPIVPPTNPPDTNTVYLGGRRARENVKCGTDGFTYKYTIAGEYRYQFLDPTLVKEQYPIPPWLLSASLDNLGADMVGPLDLIWGDQSQTSALNAQAAQAIGQGAGP